MPGLEISLPVFAGGSPRSRLVGRHHARFPVGRQHDRVVEDNPDDRNPVNNCVHGILEHLGGCFGRNSVTGSQRLRRGAFAR